MRTLKTRFLLSIVGVLTMAVMVLSPVTALASNAVPTHPHNAPQFQFETTWNYDQWGRPTTSNRTPDLPQNIRRDRHSAFLPPPAGHVVGHFSGEFSTNRVNPFAPTANNNPDASRAVGVNDTVFANTPGQAGVNVRAVGEQTGGFLAPTSVGHNAPVAGNSAAQGNVVQAGTGTGGNAAGANTNPPWAALQANQQSAGNNQPGLTVNHTPIGGGNSPQISQPQQQTNQPQANQGVQQNVPQGQRTTKVTPFQDGTIGIVMIPALNREAMVRPGVDLVTLDHYIGHFPGTSQWDGNIGLASHNRGPGSFFAGIWTLETGDRIFYATTLGVRAYEVVSVELIQESNMDVLNHSHENTLTLITCVYNQPAMRWKITAREVRA